MNNNFIKSMKKAEQVILFGEPKQTWIEKLYYRIKYLWLYYIGLPIAFYKLKKLLMKEGDRRQH